MTLNEKLEMLNEMLTKNYITKKEFDMVMTGLFLLENDKKGEWRGLNNSNSKRY